MSAAEMREALKPCPFCGGEAELYESGTVAGVICERDNSHSVVVSRSKDASGEAVSAWNRRAPLPDEEGMATALAALRHYAEPCDAPPSGPCPYEGNMCCKVARAAIRAINGGRAMTTALQTVSDCEACKHWQPPRHPLDDHWCAACALPVYEAIRPGQCGPKRDLYAKREDGQ